MALYKTLYSGFRRSTIMVVAAVSLFTCVSAAGQSVGVHKDGVPTDTAGIHYRVFRADGSAIDLQTLIAAAAAADVVFMGEEHDDPIGHYLQLQVFKGIHDLREEMDGTPRPMVLSMEMFEADVQGIVDEYLGGFISEKQFRSSARPWPNYEQDYRPSVEFARENGIPVVAANAPRRYASRVTANGPESLLELPESSRQWLPPLPYGSASAPYIKEWNDTMRENGHGMGMDEDTTEIDDSVALYPNMLAAQSLWDATMAYSIARAMLDHPGSSVIHFVGAFHVENRTGIPEHLLRYRPGTKIAIVSMRSNDDLASFVADPQATLGDYIVVTDGKLPRTHER